MPVNVLLRSEKGSALTHTELDQNMSDLEIAVNAARPEIDIVNSATYTFSTLSVVLADATAQPITVTLPDPATNSNRIFYLKKIDNTTNTVTLLPNSTETIDGASSYVLSLQYETIKVISDGTNWYVL